MTKYIFLTIVLLPLGVAEYGCQAPETELGSMGAAVTDPCAPPTNVIVCENSKPGTPSTEWDITSGGVWVGSSSIQGFATQISVNRGDIVHFKIDTDSTSYHMDIYRIGYYQGDGARLVQVGILPSVTLPQVQGDNCLDSGDPTCSCITTSDQLVDCGNWHESASWAVPSDATSGVYIAKLVRDDGDFAGLSNHIIFVVRDDTGGSDILFQTSDTTWQAYNSYGGVSLYGGTNNTQVPRVSYNRPFIDRGGDGVTGSTTSFFFNAEYPMIRWLEANGYDVSYCAGVDTDRWYDMHSNNIQTHTAFLSVGHDEYWSANQRANVEAARAAGVNLAFFSGNEVTWKTHLDPSVDGSNTPYRTLVCYKETQPSVYIPDSPTTGDYAIDPGTLRIYPGTRNPGASAPWTGQWRDPTFGDPTSSPPFDGGQPENALTGTEWSVQLDFRAINVPPVNAAVRLWRNTSLGSVGGYLGENLCSCGNPDDILTWTPCGCVLGLEWDEDSDNGFRPPGLIRASSTYAAPGYFDYMLDWGYKWQAFHEATHSITLYRFPPTSTGALVFGAGTINWSWGLDNHHDFDYEWSPVAQNGTDLAMQQATVNLFADMCNTTHHCVQPLTLQPGLILATASTDSAAPTSSIQSPGQVTIGSSIAVCGMAADSGGGVVGGVDVSVDGGSTWHPATINMPANCPCSPQTCTWNYTWMPTSLGSTPIKSRAVDDTGNLESPGLGINVTVLPRSSQSLLFYNSANGNVATGILSSSGTYVNIETGTFAPNWTHIVSVKGKPKADYSGYNNILLFYRSSDGYTWIGQLDDTPAYSDLGEPNYPPGPGWTHIVAGSNDIVLFYDSTGGRIMLGRLDAVGAFAPLSAIPAPPGYTSVVAGVNNVFLFYRMDTGAAATAQLEAPANHLGALKTITGLAPGWTNIAAGLNNVLLFFKSTPGNAMSVKLNDDGSLGILHNPLWGARLGYTSIVAGFRNRTVLYYYLPDGNFSTATLDENGNNENLTSGALSSGWTHIVGP
jgi:hypothetical protein